MRVNFLAKRDRRPELMDQPSLDAAAHHKALNGLRTANKVGRVSQTIWRAILHAKSLRLNDKPLRIIDVASGGGDVLIGITKLAARRGVNIDAHGWDIS